ncbi:TPA: hypothetical protein UMV35_002844 [Stenotrophomonas maltophilia]|nr:hypothetical protein [Stenotrophomonas maltophilia]HEL7731246.1 hypothetical protein [Stenotrophomonas maltophilia]
MSQVQADTSGARPGMLVSDQCKIPRRRGIWVFVATPQPHANGAQAYHLTDLHAKLLDNEEFGMGKRARLSLLGEVDELLLRQEAVRSGGFGSWEPRPNVATSQQIIRIRMI